MKKLTALVLLILLNLNFSYAQWEVKHVEDVYGTLRIVKFYDLSHGFSMGDHGKILKTTDQGESWQAITNDIEGNIVDFDFLSLDTLIVLSNLYDGEDFTRRIYKSIDGGYTWAEIYKGPGNFDGVQFISSNVGFACGSNGIIKTADEGETWENMYDLTLNGFDYGSVRAIEMHDASAGLAIATGRESGSSGIIRSIILKTSDGGASWEQLNQDTDFISLVAIDFLNEEEGFVADLEHTYKTVDGGITWEVVSNLSTVADIALLSENKIVTVNRPENYLIGTLTEFAISFSFDFGESWDGAYQYGLHLESVFFHNDSVGYVVGDNSLIMKTESCGGEITGDYPWHLFTAVNEVFLSEIKFAPNPVEDRIYLREFEGEWNYKIIGLNGVEIMNGRVENKEITVSGIPAGTYVLLMESNRKLRKGVFVKSK